VHKPARECPITEPHPRESCGIVKARRQTQLTFGAPPGAVLVDDGGENKQEGK
jgi:hypothetical protein